MKLWRYIEGFRKGKEAHRLEREAMNDPFLADALEGFNNVESNHAKEIKKLQARISARATSKTTHRLKTLSIAAGILFVAGFGTWYAMHEYQATEVTSYTVQELTKPAEKQSEEILTVPDSELIDSVVQEEMQESPSFREESVSPMQREEIPAQAPPTVASAEMIADSSSPAEDKAMAKESHEQAALLSEDMDSASHLASVVKGHIIDTSGEPLIGASITIKGSSNGVITDNDGYFELVTHNGDKIQVSYIGYEPQTFLADTSRTMQIAMHENQTTLSETIVVGYGTTQKEAVSKSTKEKAPEPVKGMQAYNDYLKKNLIRPTDDACMNAKGEVELTFSIGQSGRPYHIRVTKGICPSANAEAIRLVVNGPAWIPTTEQATVKVMF